MNDDKKQPTLNPDCPCKYTSCPRHANCVKCRENHKGAKTACQKLADAKKK